MKPIGVAIIDQGIDLNYFRSKGLEIEEVVISCERDVVTQQSAQEEFPKLSHGTNLANIILRISPEVKLLSVKLIASKKIDVALLCKGLQYCHTRNDIRIINISLGILQKYPSVELRECCSLCHRKGMVVIAAAHYDLKLKCFPAGFPFVYGVGTGMAKKITDYEWLGKGYLNILAKGIHQRLIGEGGKMIIMNGTSYAAAAFSATVAGIIHSCGQQITHRQLRKLIVGQSQKMISTHYKRLTKKKQKLPIPVNKEDLSASRCLLFATDDRHIERFVRKNRPTGIIIKYPLNPENRFDAEICREFKCIDGFLSPKLLEHVDLLVLGNFMKNPFLINIYFGFSLLELFLRYNGNILLLDDNLITAINDLIAVLNIDFRGGISAYRSHRYSLQPANERCYTGSSESWQHAKHPVDV